MHKQLPIVCTALLLACATTPIATPVDTSHASPNVIRDGDDMERVAAMMAESGYKETGLAMMAMAEDEDLRMWLVGEGFLIFRFSTHDGEIVDMSYFFCDERRMSERVEFDLEVLWFDPVNGKMEIVASADKGQRHALTHTHQAVEPLEKE